MRGECVSKLMNRAIDWKLGTKLAGNNRKVAEELLLLLAKNLPHDIQKINLFWQKQDYDLLLNYMHKLRGALCYCGTPLLKSAADELDNALKKNQTARLAKLIEKFNQEAQAVLKAM